MDKTELSTAIINTNPCQRNWDHTRSIPEEDIQILLDAVKYAPTKQNETHYKVYWSTDRNKISDIYSRTKRFSVVDSTTPVASDGKVPDEWNVTNPQVDANMIIAFCHEWDQSRARALDHFVVDDETTQEALYTHIMKNRIMDISTGIAIGQVLLTANLLGYRTGCCSAFEEKEILGIEDTFCKTIIGIGYPQEGIDRKTHPDVLNRDILAEHRRTGELDDNWLFPSFDKQVSIEEI
jgi:nitroreductase